MMSSGGTHVVRLSRNSLENLATLGATTPEQWLEVFQHVTSILSAISNKLVGDAFLAIDDPQSDEYGDIELSFEEPKEWSDKALRLKADLDDRSGLAGLVAFYGCSTLDELFDGGLRFYMNCRLEWLAGNKAVIVNDEIKSTFILTSLLPPFSWTQNP